jgi:hypothetical protein
VNGILTELRRTAEKMILLSDDTLTCAEKFSLARTGLMHSVGAAEAQFEDIEINLTTPQAIKSNADKDRPGRTL